MLISLKHDFAFLCNRKCASISIETMLRKHSDIAVLGPPGFRHADYRLYSKYFAPFVGESMGRAAPETICLVREPLSWLYSFYRFRSRFELLDPKNPHHRNSTHGVPFEEFVRSYMQPAPPPYADVGCQFDFVRTDDNEVGVDRVFLYEDMGGFVDFMSARIGRRLTIRYKNASPKKNRTLPIAALGDRVVKTATGLLNIAPSVVSTVPGAELPQALRTELEHFMARDHALYEQARARAEAVASGEGAAPLARQRAIR